MKNVRTAVRMLNEMDKRARSLLLWGVGVSLFLLIGSAFGMLVNISLYHNPDIRHVTMVGVENAASIFTLSIGAGLLADYGLKKITS